MIKRTANATWKGNLKEGKGKFTLDSGIAKDAEYSFKTRFGEDKGSNPEELLAAAHAACYSMALAHELSSAGFTVNSIHTVDKVLMEFSDSGISIKTIEIHTEGDVEDISNDEFQKHAEGAKKNCPVSKAITGVEYVLKATLK
jgi:osmotically inducible protein OsmC